jgi:hypothetical protein
MGKAPTLRTVSLAFMSGTSISWLTAQLYDLSEFSGCKNPDEKQYEDLARTILNSYGYLKLTELMDFFRRFKAGEYGKFYGSVDPLVITTTLRLDYLRTRAAILDSLRREDEQLQRMRDPEFILDWYAKETRRRMMTFYSWNFRSCDFTMEEFLEIAWLFRLGDNGPDCQWDDTNPHGYLLLDYYELEVKEDEEGCRQLTGKVIKKARLTTSGKTK